MTVGPTIRDSADDNSDPPRSVDEIAADWVARKGRGLTPAEDGEFLAWLAADPRHALTFDELWDTWRSLDQLKDAPLPNGRPLGLRVVERTRPTSLKRLLVFMPLAAAAAFATVLYRPKPLVYPRLEVSQTASTSQNGFKLISLPDGSVVQMNANTAVQVRYDGAQRTVFLVRGEASFDVAKDAARPFVVRVHSVEVRAVGTAFDIRRSSNGCDVLVSDGKVRVDSTANGRSLLPATSTPDSVPLLYAGDHASVLLPSSPDATAKQPDPTARVEQLDTATLRRELAWQNRQLDFEATPLFDIVAEFNRHNHHKLVIADARLAAQRFGGTFNSGNLDAFLRLLVSQFGVTLEQGDHVTTLRLDR